MPYFITGAIYKKRLLLEGDELKEMLKERLFSYFQKVQWRLDHWVILDNHYHVMGMSHDGIDLTKLIKGIHGSTASIIHEATKCPKPVWWNYWDYCPRDERDYTFV